MRHPLLKEGDTVRVHAAVVETTADYIGVVIGSDTRRCTVYVPRESIASVDDNADADVIDALTGPMGKIRHTPLG